LRVPCDIHGETMQRWCLVFWKFSRSIPRNESMFGCFNCFQISASRQNFCMKCYKEIFYEVYGVLAGYSFDISESEETRRRLMATSCSPSTPRNTSANPPTLSGSRAPPRSTLRKNKEGGNCWLVVESFTRSEMALRRRSWCGYVSNH
jgi:hypothetical protein